MVKVIDISKKYANKYVISDISFQANPGECIGIIGKNGCGKTTLISALAGVSRPNTGEIQYFNKYPLKNKKDFEKICGYIPQGNPLIEDLNVYDNIRLWTAGKNSKKILEDCIQMFDLKNILNKKVSHLSGGMKRRVTLACAMAKFPPIMLMDEPTSALDLYYKAEIHGFMKDYLEKKGIIIIATHDKEEIDLCSRILYMENGKLRELPKGSNINNTIDECMRGRENERNEI